MRRQEREASGQTQHNNTLQTGNDTAKTKTPAVVITPDFRECLYLRSATFVSVAPETLRNHFLHHPISSDDELVGLFGSPNTLACAPFSNGLNIRSAVFHSVPVRKGVIIYTRSSVRENITVG